MLAMLGMFSSVSTFARNEDNDKHSRWLCPSLRPDFEHQRAERARVQLRRLVFSAVAAARSDNKNSDSNVSKPKSNKVLNLRARADSKSAKNTAGKRLT